MVVKFESPTIDSGQWACKIKNCAFDLYKVVIFLYVNNIYAVY